MTIVSGGLREWDGERLRWKRKAREWLAEMRHWTRLYREEAERTDLLREMQMEAAQALWRLDIPPSTNVELHLPILGRTLTMPQSIIAASESGDECDVDHAVVSESVSLSEPTQNAGEFERLQYDCQRSARVLSDEILDQCDYILM